MANEVVLERPKDGVDAVEVNAIKVKVGDVVTKGQALLEVQADKAQLEVMAPYAGRIAKILVKEGDEIKVGKPYCVIESDHGAAAPAAAPAKPPAAPATSSKPPAAPAATTPAPAPEKSTAPPAVPAAPLSPTSSVVAAGPATRKLARELGIDLTQVTGSARGGRVTPDDLKAFVRQLTSGGSGAATGGGAGTSLATPPLPRFEDFGPVDRQKLSMIRKATSRQMSLSWNVIPHVTQNDESDITDLEAFRKAQNAAGQKLTVTAFALKAAAIALKRFESFNASLDSANGQLVLKRYYHIGVAVDTPTGLVVPVIRDVDRKNVIQLAGELTAIAERARLGKLDSKDLSGGTFTITNLGGIGGTGFTPIVNWPEVAILGMSRGKLAPVYKNGQFVPRLQLPLSLSYDHRVIDGAAAARFTRLIADLLENPMLLSLHS